MSFQWHFLVLCRVLRKEHRACQHTSVKESIQETESRFLCTGANLRQIYKHISFNHVKFFGNIKHFNRSMSKPQFLVIQPFVIVVNDYTSTEGSPEGDFVTEEPTLTCRRLNLYLFNYVI